MGQFDKTDLSNLKGITTIYRSVQDRDKVAAEKIKRDSKEKDLSKLQTKLVQMFSKHNLCVSAFEEIGSLPELGFQYRIVTQQQLNAFSLILFVSKFSTITEMYVTVYSINEKTIAGLFSLMDEGSIQNLTLVIADSMRQLQPKRIDQLKEGLQLRRGRIKLAFTHNHTKIAIMKTDKGFFVIEGSGNFSDNARIEQYVFENSQDIYEFHKSWIDNYVFGAERKKYKRHQIIE